MKAQNKIYILTILAISTFSQAVFAVNKILVIVESNCLSEIQGAVTSYCTAISEVDHKKCELIDWTNPGGTPFTESRILRDTLQNEYFEARNAGDVLEGAVLIGNVHEPLARDTFISDFH
ncbi:MAG: hypothetical protein JXA71_19845 [Chitinispirillaceae bacterium]|nr:hypothetical protein [Chitinispirillaceae bacterium]